MSRIYIVNVIMFDFISRTNYIPFSFFFFGKERERKNERREGIVKEGKWMKQNGN